MSRTYVVVSLKIYTEKTVIERTSVTSKYSMDMFVRTCVRKYVHNYSNFSLRTLSHYFGS